jgi:hypothetical protein
MVPLLIKVQQLQRRLINQPDDVGTAWNWVDAFVRLEYHKQPAVYRFLRQALLSRRVLLLLDGLDEGGAKRSEIERHVTEVLAPQGHVMLCTSRPAGLTETRFAGFRRLYLSPLTEAQQREALEQRLGADKVGPLLEYVEKKVPDGKDGQRVTSNPLMLSMFASIYELRQGVGMPETVAELYQHASEAMLARGGASSTELRRLMQAIFFEAHVSGQRQIEDQQLDEAALSLELPEVLAAIRKKCATTSEQLRNACTQLSPAMHSALEQVRHRVARDELPLFSLLQTEPLQLQSSHLSFQEYFAARALCEEGTRLSGPPPWDWSAWWANAARLGSEMGGGFGKGILHAAGVEGDVLDLSGKLGGDSTTAAAVLAAVVRSHALTSLDASSNKLGDTNGMLIAKALTTNTTLKLLNLACNQLGSESAKALAIALDSNTTLTQLDLGDNSLGDESGKLLAEVLKSNTTLTQLELGSNNLGYETGKLLAEVLKSNTTLTQLELGSNNLGDETGKLLAEVLKSNTTLTQLDLGGNRLGAKSGKLLAEVLRTNTSLTHVDLGSNSLGDESGILLAEGLKTNTSLTQLNLASNTMGGKSGGLLVAALTTNKSLTALDISGNGMGEGNARALRQLVSKLKGGCSECTGQAGTADCFHCEVSPESNQCEWDKCHVCGAHHNVEWMGHWDGGWG